MRRSIGLVLFACLALGLSAVAAVVETSPSGAAVGVTLHRPQVGEYSVVLTGRTGANARVRIVRRTEDAWVRVAVVRANPRGRFRLALVRPTSDRWVVRAVVGGVRSMKRTIAPVTIALDPVPDPVPEPPTEQPTEPVMTDDACGPRLQKADGTWWDCTFVDEFDGDAIDPTKWVAQETSLSGVTNGSACYVKSPSTLSVADGALRLSAVKTAERFDCRSPFGSFTTDRAAATVTTKGRFSQAYGRFEVRAKMAETRVQGAHAAFWLFPDARKYGAWPLSGEIDVAEWYSAVPHQVFPSVHYVDGHRNIHTGQDGIVADVSAYHTYAVEWTPQEMRFYFDGVLTFQHSWTPLAPLLGSQPFDQPFNVVLTQAWGGLWNLPTAETPDTVTMSVDRVRVWR